MKIPSLTRRKRNDCTYRSPLCARVSPVQETDPVIPETPDAIPAEDAYLLKRIGFTVFEEPALGSGSFDAVFRGEANRRAVRIYANNRTVSFAGRSVAIKFIHSTNILLDRAEAERMSNLDHPNVIFIYDVMTYAKRLYIIMEYCPDGPLYDYYISCRKKQTILGQTVCQSFVDQLLSGLLYLHAQSVTHGDIHNGNVMLVKYGGNHNDITLKYVDFGLSKMVSNDSTPFRDDLENLGRIIENLAFVVRCDDPNFKGKLDVMANKLVGRQYSSIFEVLYDWTE